MEQVLLPKASTFTSTLSFYLEAFDDFFSEFSKKFYIKEVPNSPIKCIFSLFDSISKPLAKN